jgi:hypothetical protein
MMTWRLYYSEISVACENHHMLLMMIRSLLMLMRG